jgi:hypothetical protein
VTFELLDSDRAADIPVTAVAVGGYVDGVHPWSSADWDRFPDAVVRLRIARSPLTLFADCLDSENGLATVGQTVTWASLHHADFGWAGVYCNVLRWPVLVNAFTLARVPQPWYWVAHWGVAPVIPEGAVGLQFQDSSRSGGHFDRSVMADYVPGLTQAPPITIVGGEMQLSDRLPDPATVAGASTVAEALTTLLNGEAGKRTAGALDTAVAQLQTDVVGVQTMLSSLRSDVAAVRGMLTTALTVPARPVPPPSVSSAGGDSTGAVTS